MPVNGPLLELECARCGASNTLSDQEISRYISRIEMEHLRMQPGDRLHATATGNQRLWRCAIVAENPRCGVCTAELGVDQIPVGAAEDRACVCGEPYSTFPAPAWLKAHLDTAVQVYGADRPASAESGTSDQPVPQVSGGSTEAIVMSCPQCAAGLEMTTETARHASCQFCGLELSLPPVLWRKLHPLPRMRTWYMHFEGNSLAMKRDEARQTRAAQEVEAQRQRERKEGRRKLLSWIGWGVVALIALVVLLVAVLKDTTP